MFEVYPAESGNLQVSRADTATPSPQQTPTPTSTVEVSITTGDKWAGATNTEGGVFMHGILEYSSIGLVLVAYSFKRHPIFSIPGPFRQ